MSRVRAEFRLIGEQRPQGAAEFGTKVQRNRYHPIDPRGMISFLHEIRNGYPYRPRIIFWRVRRICQRPCQHLSIDPILQPSRPRKAVRNEGEGQQSLSLKRRRIICPFPTPTTMQRALNEFRAGRKGHLDLYFLAFEKIGA